MRRRRVFQIQELSAIPVQQPQESNPAPGLGLKRSVTPQISFIELKVPILGLQSARPRP